MNICVMSLTRDRLEYTKACFRTLRDYAGCPYDHFVLDQGSTDGTPGWLDANARDFAYVEYLDDNVGISKGLNRLLAVARGYDVYVKFDNDLELLIPGTLREAARLVYDERNLIVSPRILGLNEPPPVNDEAMIQGRHLGFLGQIGGVFMAMPGWVFNDGFRYDESNPTWGMDDVQMSRWFQDQGGRLAYMLDIGARHFETTEGQKVTYPEYWSRKKQEMGIA